MGETDAKSACTRPGTAAADKDGHAREAVTDIVLQ
jgi:hypothetical protein